MAKEFTNQYDPRVPFNDNLAHFLRMDKGMVESYFAATGPLARIAAPNWVERAEDGSYELVTLDASNDVEHRWGIYIWIKQKPVTDYEAGKAKAIATWDYAISVPSADDEHAFQVFSADTLKYIFASPKGFIAAIPPRMRQQYNQLSTLKLRTKDGEIPIVPYVNLAFFMWLEDESEGAESTFNWLKENMEGWSEAYGV